MVSKDMKKKIDRARKKDSELGKRKLSKPEFFEKEIIKPGSEVPKSEEEFGKLKELKARASKKREVESKPANKFLEAYKKGKITLSEALAASKVKSGLMDNNKLARRVAERCKKENFKNIDKILAEEELKKSAEYNPVYKKSLNKFKNGDIKDVREAYASAKLKDLASDSITHSEYKEAFKKYKEGKKSALDSLYSVYTRKDFRNYNKEFLEGKIKNTRKEMEESTSILDKQAPESTEKEIKEKKKKSG